MNEKRNAKMRLFSSPPPLSRQPFVSFSFFSWKEKTAKIALGLETRAIDCIGRPRKTQGQKRKRERPSIEKTFFLLEKTKSSLQVLQDEISALLQGRGDGRDVDGRRHGVAFFVWEGAEISKEAFFFLLLFRSQMLILCVSLAFFHFRFPPLFFSHALRLSTEAASSLVEDDAPSGLSSRRHGAGCRKTTAAAAAAATATSQQQRAGFHFVLVFLSKFSF